MQCCLKIHPALFGRGHGGRGVVCYMWMFVVLCKSDGSKYAIHQIKEKRPGKMIVCRVSIFRKVMGLCLLLWQGSVWSYFPCYTIIVMVWRADWLGSRWMIHVPVVPPCVGSMLCFNFAGHWLWSELLFWAQAVLCSRTQQEAGHHIQTACWESGYCVQWGYRDRRLSYRFVTVVCVCAAVVHSEINTPLKIFRNICI